MQSRLPQQKKKPFDLCNFFCFRNDFLEDMEFKSGETELRKTLILIFLNFDHRNADFFFFYYY